MSSPSKERYGDRFIPVRSGNNWETNFSSIPVSAPQYYKRLICKGEMIFSYENGRFFLSGILMFIS